MDIQATTGRDRTHRYAGTAREVGRAAGRALGSSLEQHIAYYLRERPRTPDALDRVALERGALPWLRTLPVRFQDELEGLADGAGLPLQRIAEWSYVESCVDDGCSAFVGRIGGHAWIARNNDMFVPGIWGHVTIREIGGRIPTLSFGQEGDVFTATGVNRERLWLHHQALPVSDAPRRNRPHVAGWVLLTDLLETCTTIADVDARLGEIDRDDGMILFALDGKNDELAIIEAGCSQHVRRTTGASWQVGTNHALMLDGPPPSASSRARQARLEAKAADLCAREADPNLPADLIDMLGDDDVERRGEHFATVYANVACPATGELWFSFGPCPAASRGDWRVVPWPWE